MHTKWLIAENDAHILNYDINKDLAKLGGIQQAKNKFDKNVSKAIYQNLRLNKKTFFCTMKAIILITHFIQN